MNTVRAVAVALPLVLLAACASAPPPTLYVLAAPAPPPAAAVSVRHDHRLAVALGPVSVPDYLDRTDIVRRTPGNRLDIDPDNRWAEPLRAGLQRLLIAALAGRLGPDYWVTAGAGRPGPIDVDVPVDIEAFEADETGQAVLTASWEVHAGPTLIRNRTSYHRPVTADTTEARVQALSANAADLAADLAAAVRAAGR